MDAQTSKQILSDIGIRGELPAMPRVIARALEMIQEPDVDLDGLTALLGQDPALSSSLLKAANSVALGGTASGVRSVREALIRLGISEVHSIVATCGAVNAFPEAPGLDLRAFWRHSAATAVCVGEIAGMAPVLAVGGRDDSAIGGPYYLAGLLHDIGVLLLTVSLGERYLAVLRKNDTVREPLWVTEESELGFHHGLAGAALLYDWGLPEITHAATEWHHLPYAAPEDVADLVRVIHVADWITHHFGIGDARDGCIDRFSDTAWQGLGLELEQFGSILAAMRSAAELGDCLMQWVER